jgi:predicted AAA+ superfamily ATPase
MQELFIQRQLELSENNSFFLFGARGTGKSTLIERVFSPDKTLFIDLLDTEELLRFRRNPSRLHEIVTALPKQITHVVIDEIQKLPKRLDSVQRLMKEKKWSFVLTGSSAGKLKHGGANLLAGRAFVYHLFPYSYFEIQEQFDLDQALQWGLLPEIFEHKSERDKEKFLYAYAHTYVKEEIWEEQLIRDLDPFHRFLEVAAQSNGKIINYSNIARDVGVNDSTVKSYYSLLEDTLLGFYLVAHHNSFRKRLQTKPKFYLFDTGVTRCLNRLLSAPLIPSTTAYGEAFEHFIILECHKLASYFKPDYRFSYIRTKDDVEVDLVIDRPRLPMLCIEIKSNDDIQRSDITSFINLTKDIPNSEAICLSRDKYAKKIDHVIVLPWRDGLKKIFDLNQNR